MCFLVLIASVAVDAAASAAADCDDFSAPVCDAATDAVTTSSCFCC